MIASCYIIFVAHLFKASGRAEGREHMYRTYSSRAMQEQLPGMRKPCPTASHPC